MQRHVPDTRHALSARGTWVEVALGRGGERGLDDLVVRLEVLLREDWRGRGHRGMDGLGVGLTQPGGEGAAVAAWTFALKS